MEEKTHRDGPLGGTEYTHPSYGLLSFNRVSMSHGTALFGSSLKHSTAITLTLSTARLHRSDLHSDHVFTDKRIVELMMSPAQFADLITGLNHGQGTPVTIDWREGVGHVEEPPYHSKVDEFSEEFADNVKEIGAAFDAVIEDAARRKLSGVFIKQLVHLRGHIDSHMPFMAKQWTRQMQRTATEAKAEVEAFVTGLIRSTGIKTLREQTPLLPDASADTIAEAEEGTEA